MMLGRYASRNGTVHGFRHFKVSQCLLLEGQIVRESSFRVLAEIGGNDYGFFQGRSTILAFTWRNRSNPGKVSIRSVGISVEIQTEYLPLQVRNVTTRTFFPRTEKHYEQCSTDGPLTTMHHKKMTIAPAMSMRDK